MKAVEQDLDEMLEHTHRRWINERTPQTEAAFNRVLAVVFARTNSSSPVITEVTKR